MDACNPSKKILCVGRHGLGSNALRRANVLGEMGYEVAHLNCQQDIGLGPQIVRRVVAKLTRSWWSRSLRFKLLRQCRDFQPDIVFIEKALWLDSATIQKIKALPGNRIVIYHYNPDDPFGEYDQGWAQFIAAIESYDVHFVPKEENIIDYQKHGAKHVIAFDRSYDPSLHRPITLSKDDLLRYQCNLGFIGSWAPHREAVIAELIGAGYSLKIWGNGWPNKEHWETIQHCWCGPSQFGEDYIKAINGMKIALHFLRHENRDEQDSRTFEIPACEVFMLAERSAAHGRLFSEDVEAVYFEGAGDLAAKIDYYLNHDDSRQAVAEAGRQRCLNSGYDHASRLSELFAKADALLK